MERMTGVPPLAWQGSLFDDPAGDDLSFDRLVRHRLDERSWLDEVPGWLPDHDEVFSSLLAGAPWRQRERRMYERTVLEPRMVAGWSGPSLADLPPRLEEVRAAVSAHLPARLAAHRAEGGAGRGADERDLEAFSRRLVGKP